MPQALSNRPNLVTKAALVEQACALSKYEVNDQKKYDHLLGNYDDNVSFSSVPRQRLQEPISETKKIRILRHHSKIMTAKQKQRRRSTQTVYVGTDSPSPQLVSALRRIFEKPTKGASAELVSFKSMLQSVMDHPAFSVEDIKDEQVFLLPTTDVSKRLVAERNGCGEETTYNLESLIAYLCNEMSSSSPPFPSTLEHGLLITVLSILTEFDSSENDPKEYHKGKRIHTEQKDTEEEEEQQRRRQFYDATNDPTAAPSLQVGSILTLMKIDTGEEDNNASNPWSLDSDLLSYLGEAASVYEERIEIQQSRLLKRLSDKKIKTDESTKGYEVGHKRSCNKEDDTDAVSSMPNTPTPAVLRSPQPVETPATPDVVATEVHQEGSEASSEALGATVFEQIVAVASGDGISPDEADNNYDNDSDIARNQAGDEQDENSVVVAEAGEDNVNEINFEEDGNDNGNLNVSLSSASTSHSNENPGNEIDNEESDDDNDNDNDDELVLRQALALSLVEQVESYSTQIDSSSSNNEEEDELSPASASTETSSICPLTPVNRSSYSKEFQTNEDIEESPLPSIPSPPRIDPFASLRGKNIQIDDDRKEKDSLSFDPSALHVFGSIPASNVLIQLLLNMNALLEYRLVQYKSECSKKSKEKKIRRETAISGGVGSLLFTPRIRSFKTKFENGNDRNDIATSLQLLVSLFLLSIEMRNDGIDNLKRAIAQEKKDNNATAAAKAVGESRTSGEEGDDPAIALGLTYIEDENFESKESLEAKGMRRKAAAAARDAAALTESLRKRTNAWKQQLNFFSKCCFLSMKCLHLFLQCVTRNWLRENRGISCTDCHKMLPTAVISKLSIALASLSSSVVTNSIQEESLNSVESIFMHTKLYKLSILLWGESVPIIYPSVVAQFEMLRSLLNECAKQVIPKRHQSIENIVSLPLVDSESSIHRLQILTRRLRVSDLLNRYVSGPMSHPPDNDELRTKELGEPNCARSVIDLIRSTSIVSSGSLKDDLRGLYLALCHRYHLRVLLWDGLGTCTKTEVDGTAASITTSSIDSLRVNPTSTNAIQFDATKCSDSMSIVSNSDSQDLLPSSSSIHQRASKVWGSVLSSTPFTPKTGIHRWAIRLDKCERGHVFIGVATVQASMRTYVGGDKYGWGMIGTQALWHDRRKIRGDYGATFRTGSTIIVTLDTNAGTISYSSWKKSSQKSSQSIDQVIQSISSSHRYGQGSGLGIVEDWGVAFEGLPLDSKLYPAVGLYQRDDKATLLTVELGTSGRFGRSTSSTEGLCYYPTPSSESENLNQALMSSCEKIRIFNEKVQLDGIHYVISSLEKAVCDGPDDLWRYQLPSLASAICLFPRHIPILSKRFGLSVISKLTKIIPDMEKSSKSSALYCRLFQNGLREGKWVIRATGSTGINADAEEYVVDLTSSTEGDTILGFEGNGIGTIGKSKNGLVSIVGTVNGSSVHFVEEWTDKCNGSFSSIPREGSSSSCIVNARMSLDGTKFEGTYHNVQIGSAGNIAGLLRDDNFMKVSKLHLKESPNALNTQSLDSSCGVVSLLCLAHSHLASIIGEDFVVDDWRKVKRPKSLALTQKEWKIHSIKLRNCLTLNTFAQSSLKLSEADTARHVKDLREYYLVSNTFRSGELLRLSDPLFEGLNVFKPDNSEDFSLLSDVAVQVENIDDNMCTKCGGSGSLAALCPGEYHRARRLLTSALIIYCRKTVNTLEACDSELKEIWIWAVKLMEDGVRRSIARNTNFSVRAKAIEYCHLSSSISKFLLCLDVSGSYSTCINIDTIGEDFSMLYSLVSSQEDLVFLREELCRSSRRALLRIIPIREILYLLELPLESYDVIESLVVAVPRLLGRGYINITRSERNGLSLKEELGSHYLSNLPGVASSIKSLLQQYVQQLLISICRIAEDGVTQQGKWNLLSEIFFSVDSMTLALISCLTIVLRMDDIEGFVLKSRLLTLIPAILDIRRPCLISSPGIHLSSQDDKSIIKGLHKTSHIEVSRAILRATVALGHVVFYQTWKILDAGVNTGVEAASACLEVVFKELAEIQYLVLDEVEVSTLEVQSRKRRLQWELFCKECSGKSESKGKPDTKPKSHRVLRSGIKFIEENGLLTNVQPRSHQKALSTRKSSLSSLHGSEKFVKNQGNFSHQFFSHWLHILFAAIGIEISRTAIVKAPSWIATLFQPIGIKMTVGEGRLFLKSELHALDIRLPARYRCRLLRLLYPILECMVPSKELAQCLFTLAGSSCTSITLSQDEDEGTVMREIVSLIRRLHFPTRTPWRACINDLISHNLTLIEPINSTERNSKVGVLCFLNGSFDSVKKGSHVLLKPAAAVPLSADRQAPSGSKSHTNSSLLANSLPYHLVGNGTEGVVAGLCRFDATAGIVSSIDTKNGVCEVILLKRNSNSTESQLNKGTGTSGDISNSPRPALTVRALRSPMVDIVLSQEVPVIIDESMLVENLVLRLLEDSTSVLRKARYGLCQNEDTIVLSNLWLHITDVTIALMSLRSVITLLSNENIAASFIKHKKARSIVSEALRFAYPDNLSSVDNDDLMNNAKNTCLSSFPIHEVRLLHALSLFRNLSSEERILEETPETSWDERLQEVEKRIEAEDSNCVDGSIDAGCKTPTTEDRAQQNTSAVNLVDGSAETSTYREESSANRIASQSTASSENGEDGEENEAAGIAAAHLREAAIAQMAELGLPRSWSELALRRTGGTNIEAAVHFCLERGGEMERLLAEEREQHSFGGSGRRRSSRVEASSHLLRQLSEMGFPPRWCAEALTATDNNVDEALTWILTNGERLNAEDEGMDNDDDDDDDEGDNDEGDNDDDDDEEEDDDDDSQETIDQQQSSLTLSNEKEQKQKVNKNETLEVKGWTGSIVPLRFISGRSIIDKTTLTISGLPSGGFSSVGSKGVMLTSGKWYYEAILETAGCLQIGWADGSFAGHCHSDRGDGCGDGPSSWAYDGWRRYRWHSMATEWGCRWTEGDVIGCLVDMDENVVSFTLNGKGEEIGMGVAFSGGGFRPCGGVYACVSFNRKEKLRLILGGPNSVKFKYPPPNGFRGVGEAVLECVKERDILISKETLLVTHPDGSSGERFLCDFSDGEHGHELMAWAHRYYGSDASVHLGSGRLKQSAMNSKISHSLSSPENLIAHCLSRRISAEWAKIDYNVFLGQTNFDEKSPIHILNKMKEGICAASTVICKQALTESMILSSLISRKLILNIVIATGDKFDPEVISASDNTKQESALRFWSMIEASASLRTAGWVGEAGAMAVAAEALGLGISSTESLHSRLSTLERSGFVSIGDLDEGIFLPAVGLVQMLNTVMDWSAEGTVFKSTGSTLAASAEAAICSGGGGGILLFLLKGLQAAISKSEELRCVAVACIRRAVRQLAVVEYESDDSTSSYSNEDDEDSIDKSTITNEKTPKNTKDSILHPDARLISFLTGLLLSKPVAQNIDNYDEVQTELFEAWSVGLLSASLPWRMICALTTSGILNQYPSALSTVVKEVPTLSRYYARLRSTVSRRVWAERAAVPVCSRYCQAMVELLCSVTHAVKYTTDMPPSFMSTWKKVTVDAAMPIPMPERKEQYNWELEDGWISSDQGWETWTGTMERFSVDWATPSRSTVRTLMEGGDGPPMLREGCIVIRGLDWDDSKYGNNDGKDKYEIEKAKREEEKNKSKSLSKMVKQFEADENKDNQIINETINPVEDSGEETKEISKSATDKIPKKKSKIPSPKLPIGTVISIESWNGIPGMARRVRWNLTGTEDVYRYGGDGGVYDINHVEVNDKGTRVRKRHPLPESDGKLVADYAIKTANFTSS